MVQPVPEQIMTNSEVLSTAAEEFKFENIKE